MTEKCCANCKNYCEGSGKMTTCLNAHYEYECHEPDYVCERWVGNTATENGEVMHNLMACPFCGAYLLGLRAGKTLVHPDKGCILDGFQFSDDFIPEWEARMGRCCTNCKHWKDYWDNGSDDDDDYGNGDCDHFKQTTAYDEYCTNWEMKL